MPRHLVRPAGSMLAAVFLSPPLADAAVVDYSGRLDGRTVPNAYVVAATFAPSFSGNYFVEYGDVAGNLDMDAYVRAVADGNLIPVGPGTQTASNGLFSGSGSTSAPLGTNIFLFAFDSPTPVAFMQVIALSTAPNWKVSVNDATLLATELDIFLVGSPSNGGISLSGIPFPEPAALLATAAFGVIAGRRRVRDLL